MNFLKYIIFVAFVFMTDIAWGQRQIAPQDAATMARLDSDMMARRLSLSDVQKSEVEKINSSFFNKLTVVRNSKDTGLIRQQKIQSLNTDRVSSFQKILTPEQFKLYQEDMQRMAQKMREQQAALSAKEEQMISRKDSANSRAGH